VTKFITLLILMTWMKLFKIINIFYLLIYLFIYCTMA